MEEKLKNMICEMILQSQNDYDLGELLYVMRHKCNLTRRELMGSTNDAMNLRNIEYNLHTPKIRLLKRISQRLMIPLELLINKTAVQIARNFIADSTTGRKSRIKKSEQLRKLLR